MRIISFIILFSSYAFAAKSLSQKETIFKIIKKDEKFFALTNIGFRRDYLFEILNVDFSKKKLEEKILYHGKLVFAEQGIGSKVCIEETGVEVAPLQDKKSEFLKLPYKEYLQVSCQKYFK